MALLRITMDSYDIHFQSIYYILYRYNICTQEHIDPDDLNLFSRLKCQNKNTTWKSLGLFDIDIWQNV